MPGEFYLVKIGTIWLTTDGTSGGAACLTKVDGLAKLFGGWAGATRIPLSGDPFNFLRQNLGKGIPVITKPFVVDLTVLGSLNTLFDSACSSGDPIAVSISDGPGAVDVDCDPYFEEGGLPPLNFSADFFEDDVYGVELRLITRGFTAP